MIKKSYKLIVGCQIMEAELACKVILDFTSTFFPGFFSQHDCSVKAGPHLTFEFASEFQEHAKFRSTSCKCKRAMNTNNRVFPILY